MLSSVPWPYSRADAEAFCAQPADPRAPSFAITLPQAKGAPIVGVVGFHRNDEGLGFGYWIARAHWGRGYATEAGQAALAVGKRAIHM